MKINLANIKKARNLLNKRECVAIPTETVYGKSRAAVACSSGHAAQQLAFIPLLNNGDHFISSNKQKVLEL